jgi:hypothetical protein
VGLFAPSPLAYGGVVVRFDGVAWDLLGNGLDPFANALSIGSALGDVFVGGSRDQAQFNGLARWDGNAWQDVGGGITSGQWITAIAEFDGDVIVAGLFDEMGGVPCRNIAAWNASRGWHPLGTGVNGSVYALTSRGGSLYVGGAFGDAGGVSVQGLARWQSGRWYTMPGPIGTVQTLGWYRNHLVASGPFMPSHIASLEADSTWRPLGTGLDQPALAMIESGASLFVGGFFSSAGGKAAYGFAEWREPGWVPPPAQNLAASPNPFATSAHLRYELPAAADVRVEIFDLFGHVVDRPFAGYQNAGLQDVEWRPSSASIRPGVYFVRVIVAGHDRVVRVVRVR